MRLTTAESSVWCSGFHFCTESQVWNIKEDIQREKTGLGDLTRLIGKKATDLSTLLYGDFFTKPTHTINSLK